MHDAAPVTSRGAEAATADAAASELTHWIGLWRSLIRSAMGHTAFPYARHARALDLRDLQQLLEQLDTEPATTTHRPLFFEGDLGGLFEARRNAGMAGPSGKKVKMKSECEQFETTQDPKAACPLFAILASER